MQDWPDREHYTAEDLVQIIRILRDPETGCPWDKVQTHASIRKNFTFFGHSLSVDSGYGSFDIDGSVFGMEFTIDFNGRVLASISKEWLTWGDTYHLQTADDFSDPPFLCALLIAIDNCVHNGD